MLKKIMFLLAVIGATPNTYSQENKIFTQQDTLRGSITKERSWWDLQKYNLAISIEPQKQYISGTNTITYKVLKGYNRIQIDLQSPLKITKVTQDNKTLDFDKLGAVHYINLKKPQHVGATEKITVHYEGSPLKSNRAPWEAGFTWNKDRFGFDFIGTSCQGQGASVWWPCKEHMYDEPDLGMEQYFTVPKHLVAVGNGRLIGEKRNKNKETKTYHWRVTNPINNYGVSLSVGNYVSFNDIYKGEKGKLDCSYYVLKQNLEKAKVHFKEAHRTLEALEHWFGPYPFYEDSFKLIEVPYLGMEHQSAVAYGNRYKNGYLGGDLSDTGWGLKFDFIIVHETGHEWFANNITNRDIADMWVHESFTNYSEALFVEYFYGKKAGQEYTIGLRKRIQNDIPIIGKYDVNDEGSSDMYFKGANMLHTIRHIVDNDTQFRLLLRALNSHFFHQSVSSEQVQDFIDNFTKRDFSKIYDQYLRTTQIPCLEYKKKDTILQYRWTKCVAGFDMPIEVFINGKNTKINPLEKWQDYSSTTKIDSFNIDENYFVNSDEIKI